MISAHFHKATWSEMPRQGEFLKCSDGVYAIRSVRSSPSSPRIVYRLERIETKPYLFWGTKERVLDFIWRRR